MLPLILAAQRFASSSGFGVPPSEAQRGVADSIAWVEGDFNVLSPATASMPSSNRRRRRRHLTDIESGSDDIASGDTGSGDLPDGTGVAPRELTKLLNLILTMLFALVVTVLIQWTLVLAWRHCVNRRYYEHMRYLDEQRHADGAIVNEAMASRVGGRRWLCFGQQRKMSTPPKFFPFPRSLIWPTPMFFTCCVFITGLVRASTRLLAANPPECGPLCPVAAVATLAFLAAFVFGAVVDLVRLHRAFVPSVIRWKPAARQPVPSAVGDPYLRWRAKARVQLMSVKRLAVERAASSAALGCGASRNGTHRVVPIDAMTTSSDTYVAAPEVRVPRDPAATPPPSPSKQPPPTRRSRRSSLVEVRASVVEELESRGGHKDRRIGAYTLPEEDGKEPARTERLLANPFQLWRPRPADAFQSREGFFMFRVNGATFIGRWYRVLVVLANMLFGLLGPQPLLPTGSTAAAVQTAIILSLQTSMAILLPLHPGCRPYNQHLRGHTIHV